MSKFRSYRDIVEVRELSDADNVNPYLKRGWVLLDQMSHSYFGNKDFSPIYVIGRPKPVEPDPPLFPDSDSQCSMTDEELDALEADLVRRGKIHPRT